jgi:hypothetical protein
VPEIPATRGGGREWRGRQEDFKFKVSQGKVRETLTQIQNNNNNNNKMEVEYI